MLFLANSNYSNFAPLPIFRNVTITALVASFSKRYYYCACCEFFETLLLLRLLRVFRNTAIPDITELNLMSIMGCLTAEEDFTM